MEWAWGAKSAASMAEDAYAYCEGSDRRVVDRRIQRLAKTKGRGDNAQRLVVGLLPMDGILEPLHIPESSVEWVLLPEVTFQWMQTCCPKRFQLHFGAEEDRVLSFWESLSRSPAGVELWQLHPWLRGRSPQDLRRHVPVVLFDDAGPISNSQSSYVRQFYGILGQGADRETHLLLSTGLTNDGLEDKSWEPILASFGRLAAEQDPGKWGAVLIFFAGDLDYVCNVLGLPHFNNEHSPCALCLTNNSRPNT